MMTANAYLQSQAMRPPVERGCIFAGYAALPYPQSEDRLQNAIRLSQIRDAWADLMMRYAALGHPRIPERAVIMITVIAPDVWLTEHKAVQQTIWSIIYDALRIDIFAHKTTVQWITDDGPAMFSVDIKRG